MHFLEVNPDLRKSWKYQAKIGVLGGPKPQKAPKSAPSGLRLARLTFSESFPELYVRAGAGAGTGSSRRLPWGTPSGGLRLLPHSNMYAFANISDAMQSLMPAFNAGNANAGIECLA